MNGEQFKYIINQKYNVNTLYWAPEIAIYKLHSQPEYNEEDLYQSAAIVLTLNEQSFKDRILKNINDNWLSKDNFILILDYMIDILSTLRLRFNDPKRPNNKYSLSEWQLLLLDTLTSMKHKGEH